MEMESDGTGKRVGGRGFADGLLLGRMLTAGGLFTLERPDHLLPRGEGPHSGLSETLTGDGSGCDSAYGEESLWAGDHCDEVNSSFGNPVYGEKAW